MPERGWYPEEGDPSVLRLWDGERWTPLTKPALDATRSAPEGKFRISKTVLIVTIAAAAAGAATPFVLQDLTEKSYISAEPTINSFIQKIETHDPAVSAALAVNAFPEGSVPISGNAESAGLNGLSVSVELASLEYEDPCRVNPNERVLNPSGCSSVAWADLEVTYEMGGLVSVLGVTAELQRPLFYDGGEVSGNLTGVGEWGVTRLLSDQSFEDLSDGSGFEPDVRCSTIGGALVQLSVSSRVAGTLGDSCSVMEKDIKLGSGVDLPELIANFPIYNERTNLGAVDLTGVQSVDGSGGLASPYSQTELVAGDKTYVLSFTTRSLGGSGEYVLRSIVQKGAAA